MKRKLSSPVKKVVAKTKRTSSNNKVAVKAVRVAKKPIKPIKATKPQGDLKKATRTAQELKKNAISPIVVKKVKRPKAKVATHMRTIQRPPKAGRISRVTIRKVVSQIKS